MNRYLILCSKVCYGEIPRGQHFMDRVLQFSCKASARRKREQNVQYVAFPQAATIMRRRKNQFKKLSNMMGL